MKKVLALGIFIVLLVPSLALPATESRIYVGPGDNNNGCGGNGCNYASILAAEVAEEGSLVLSDEYIVFEVYEYEEDTRLIIDGWTTSEDCYIEIRGADYDRIETGANKNVGVWSDERFRFNITGSTGSFYRSVYVKENDVKLINLQIKNTVDMGTIGIGTDNDEITRQEYVGNIIILDNDLGGVGGCFYFDEGLGSGDNAIVNNICQTKGDGSNSFLTCKYFSGCSSDGGVTAVYNNTIVFGEPSEGYHYCFNYIDSSTVLKNNLCQDDINTANRCARLYYSDDNDYNICSETTDTGGDNDQSGITDVLFEDKSNGDFHLDSSDTRALDAGDDLSSDSNYSFDTDIDGDTRSGWSIGADD